MRHLYLAATGQNRGKTTASLGLLDGFRRRGFRTGFMKPVGQRTVIEDGQPADEDAVLMRTLFDLPEPYAAMSPVHIPRGFTKSYIAGEVVEDLGARIVAAHRQFTDHDVLLIEGTGHAGVGAVIGLSNAVVAAMLGAPAVIVSEGGVGRPIDEIVLNASHFAAHGVPVAGALVNKVRIDEQPGIERTLERGLARHGIPLLGVLPYRPILSNPTLGMVLQGVRGRVIHPGPDLDRVIDGVAIGAMEPNHMLDHIGPGTLVIVPGDREDAILTLTSAHLAGPASRGPPGWSAGRRDAGRRRSRSGGAAIGIVLTGGTSRAWR
jgi:BioD-like phosphotransacetylase family protein